LYGLLFAGAVLVYAVDFGYFFYLHQRIDATLFDFLGNLGISGRMVWESYPVLWITAGLLSVSLLYAGCVNRVLARHVATTGSWKRRTAWTAGAFVVLFLLAYGQISSNLFPLRWSNAYFSVDKDLALLALNPIQNLRDTTNAAHGTRPNLEATRESYPRVAAWLRLPKPDQEKLDFVRTVPGQPVTLNGKPLNVIVIIMESMTWSHTSFAPNLTDTPEDPTPNLAALAKESLFFPTFFAPTRTTARAVFTTMTGIPDVNHSGGTSSRNQALVDQALLMNEFKGYAKFYMIGGSASWANIRGILEHNISDLNLMEEGAWQSPNVDVWGISDLALLRETAEVLSTVKGPFVTVVQTAGFHRPYTIPADNEGFEVRQPSPEILKNYGYTEAAEYNSLRFSDHALGVFFRIARTKPWFENTVFAIFGDHGLTDTSSNMTPGYLGCNLQSNHVPMLLYAPGLTQHGVFPPGVSTQPCGQPDIFPTVASLIGLPYRYTGLGRNLLDPDTKKDARQFLGGNTEAIVRLVENGYCYVRNEQEALYKLDAPELENLIESDPERASHMRQSADDFFNASKYLLYNNKKP
ncbi:MAG: sulfatase-like hydrolase/transferase, partial [Bilophila sp.]